MANQEAVELKTFVLSCLQAMGALTETPAYGLVDVLLPDERAGEFGNDTFLHLAFDEEAMAAHPEAEYLTYGSPLLDKLIELTRGWGLTARWYINDLRLEKKGLFELVEKEIGFSNAWLSPVKEIPDHALCFHYVLFNFKVSYISDEKQESLVTLLMDLDAGRPAIEVQEMWGGVILDTEQRFRKLPEASLAYRPEVPPLSEESLRELSQRAAQAMEERIAPIIASYQRKIARRLELDQARLNDFYNETRKELERRLRRAEGDEERRRSIEEKLAFTEMERERKLTDIEAKHRLRVVLELINAALISLPKLVTRVQVANRYVSIQRDFIWNPLIHRLEEPLCEVCRQPTRHLHLCAGGHLACEDCIVKCSACKREYCRLCEDQMGACTVCGRALCLKSQTKCRVCGQITCRDHEGECH